ncbi:MAG TPA: response regulator [Bacteroidetes bacterium]|nr:response regulator [Bacteroidota bacterium]
MSEPTLNKTKTMSTKQQTILVVDDDMDYLLQLETMLKKMGFRVETAESQKEGEDKLEKVKPDLAIVDLMMENMDSGFILSRKIKQRYPEVPVVIATAVTSETGMIFGLDTEEEKQWIKADLYLEKGLREDQLHREITRLLKQAGR